MSNRLCLLLFVTLFAFDLIGQTPDRYIVKKIPSARKKAAVSITVGDKVVIQRVDGTISDYWVTSLLDSTMSVMSNNNQPAAIYFKDIRKIRVDEKSPKKIFRARIRLATGQLVSGYLNRLTDSVAEVIGKRGRNDEIILRLPANAIKSIILRRKNSVEAATWWGASIGVVVGGIGAYSTYKQNNKQLIPEIWPEQDSRFTSTFVSAVYTGFLGGVAGAGVGLFARKKYTINGNVSAYQAMVVKLKRQRNLALLQD